ncbi:MAG: hypothetical protein QOI95_2914 [Acidimicrobiaceae bacterium]
MCACDEELGRRVLPHQLEAGTDLSTQGRVPVTAGFADRACAACRGDDEPALPVAEIRGRTSKIKRYYWREIQSATLLRFADWCDENGEGDVLAARTSARLEYERIEGDVLAEVKCLHAASPKYHYNDPSQEDVIRQCGLQVINVPGLYVKGAGRDRPLVVDGQRSSPEEFASVMLRREGFVVMRCESLPLQALYGVLMWLWVQDPSDPLGKPHYFGGREDLTTAPRWNGMIGTVLPDDFGTEGHARRRATQLDEHLDLLPADTAELLWLFDYWVRPSSTLCAYLWAYTPFDLDRARQLIEVLGASTTKRICRFLAESYWSRYLGWPDLFAYREAEAMFVEVKWSKDRLSQQQSDWLRANHTELHLPVRLMKIHRTTAADETASRVEA